VLRFADDPRSMIERFGQARRALILCPSCFDKQDHFPRKPVTSEVSESGRGPAVFLEAKEFPDKGHYLYVIHRVDLVTRSYFDTMQHIKPDVQTYCVDWRAAWGFSAHVAPQASRQAGCTTPGS